MSIQIAELSTGELQLKQVLRHMPAPVGLVTSYDTNTGEPVGLAMSALMPVSLDPCAMAICVNRSGSAYGAMIQAGRFCINLLGPDLAHHMRPFADPAARDERFVHADWAEHGRIRFIRCAPASIFCTIRQTSSFGTHDLLVGEVDEIIGSGTSEILGWANGGLGLLSSLG
jgi:flavin reductase (DIM6/NTAB) family NADH-FMN oxidoreductase RutF